VNTPLKRSGMACVLKGTHSSLHTPHSSANGMTPAFAFPDEAGTHLPTPEGWKAELALVYPVHPLATPRLVQKGANSAHVTSTEKCSS